MATYKKDGKEFQAIQWNLKDIDAIRKLVSPGTVNISNNQGVVMTKFASFSLTENDYIVKGKDGSFSAVEKTEFETNYKKLK